MKKHLLALGAALCCCAYAHADALDLLRQLRDSRTLDAFQLQHVTQLVSRTERQAVFIDQIDAVPTALLVTLDGRDQVKGAALFVVGSPSDNARIYQHLHETLGKAFGVQVLEEGDSRNCTADEKLDDRRVAAFQKNTSLTYERIYPFSAVLLSTGAVPPDATLWQEFSRQHLERKRLDAARAPLWARYRENIATGEHSARAATACRRSTGNFGAQAPLALGSSVAESLLDPPDMTGLRAYRSPIEFEGVLFYEVHVLQVPGTRTTRFVSLQGRGNGAAYMQLRRRISDRLGRATTSLARVGEGEPTAYQAVWEDKRQGIMTSLVFEPQTHQLSLQYGGGAGGGDRTQLVSDRRAQ